MGPLAGAAPRKAPGTAKAKSKSNASSKAKGKAAEPESESNIARVVAGGDKSCLITLEGKGFCWGRNEFMELANKKSDKKSDKRPVAAVPGARGITDIGIGQKNLCFLLLDGTAMCRGENLHGQRGDNAPPKDTKAGQAVLGVDGGAQLAVGREGHACVRLKTGGVVCWGRNGDGSVGDGTTEDRFGGTDLGDLKNVVSLQAGGGHSCALMKDGSVRCWGRNPYGECGDKSGENVLTPKVVPGLRGVAELALGDAFSCARTRDKSVWCWGFRPGETTAVAEEAYKPVKLPGFKGAVEIAAGATHACIRGKDQAVLCWGDNQYGQLGDDNPDQRTGPTKVKVGKTVQLALGRNHTCARLTDGTISCWGDNRWGQALPSSEQPSITAPETVDMPNLEEP